MKPIIKAIIFGTVIFFIAVRILGFLAKIFPVIRDPSNFSVVIFMIMMGVILGFLASKEKEHKVLFATMASLAAVAQLFLVTFLFSPQDFGADLIINSALLIFFAILGSKKF